MPTPSITAAALGTAVAVISNISGSTTVTLPLLASTGSELPFTSERIAFSTGNGNMPDSVPNVRPNVKTSPVVPLNGVEGIE